MKPDGNTPELSRTKALLAETIIELGSSVPMQRITVKKLCEKCGLQRQSFYYHFRDKYDLIAWVFMQDYRQGLQSTEILNTEEMMRDNLRRMEQKRNFYRHALADYSQNSLRKILLELYVGIEEEVLKRHLRVEKLELEAWYTITGYSYACLEHTCAWLNGENRLTADELAHQMYLTMPGILKTAYQNRLVPAESELTKSKAVKKSDTF